MSSEIYAAKAREWTSRVCEWWKEHRPDWSDVVECVFVLFCGLGICGLLGLVLSLAIPPVAEWTDMQSKRWEVERLKLEIDKREYTKELAKLKAEEEKQKELWLTPLETSFPPKAVTEDIPVLIQP